MANEKKTEKTTETPKPKRTILRSPNYPAFGLEEAISKAKILWEKDHRAGSSMESALQHLGFKGTDSPSGPAGRTIATLKKFGLTEDRDGRIYLSQVGLDICIYPNTDDRYKRAVQEAALKPSIYAKVYGKYQTGLPSDETLKSELVRDEGFNPRQVDGFLSDFKKTLEFAGLKFGSEEFGKEELNGQDFVDALAKKIASGAGSPRATSGGSSFPILLKRQQKAVISFTSLPIDKADLDTIKKWIELQSENLTEEPTEQS